MHPSFPSVSAQVSSLAILSKLCAPQGFVQFTAVSTCLEQEAAVGTWMIEQMCNSGNEFQKRNSKMVPSNTYTAFEVTVLKWHVLLGYVNYVALLKMNHLLPLVLRHWINRSHWIKVSLLTETKQKSLRKQLAFSERAYNRKGRVHSAPSSSWLSVALVCYFRLLLWWPFMQIHGTQQSAFSCWWWSDLRIVIFL